ATMARSRAARPASPPPTATTRTPARRISAPPVPARTRLWTTARRPPSRSAVTASTTTATAHRFRGSGLLHGPGPALHHGPEARPHPRARRDEPASSPLHPRACRHVDRQSAEAGCLPPDPPRGGDRRPLRARPGSELHAQAPHLQV